MAAVRFRFRNRPAISAREARAVAELLTARGTDRATRLAAKILDHAKRSEKPVTDLALRRTEMVELLSVLDEHASERRLASDELYRLRAELEGGIQRD